MQGLEETESMDIDSPSATKESSSGLKENGFHLYPVPFYDSGEGLPYAPEDWPSPGDKWRWKVGKRTTVTGYFLDRYLYPPKRLKEVGLAKSGFASRLSLEHFIRKKFPDTDVNAFFASFSWRIPSTLLEKDSSVLPKPTGETAEHSGSELDLGKARCKAGNKACISLTAAENSVSELMFCDICCSELGFCRDCCCILCCKTINTAIGGYSYIRCEANVEGQICGHISHIECALRAYMAGTVGGSIGLDVEYHCRRCDSRTDLVSHVTKLLQAYELTDSRDEIEKILNISISLLRGSKKPSANQLLHHMKMAMAKLKNETYLEDIWKEEGMSAVTSGCCLSSQGGSGFPDYEGPNDYEIGSPQPFSPNFDYRIESLKLEDKVDQILHALKKSQEIEYSIAEERLFVEKNYILNLYQQLDRERSDFSRYTSSNGPDPSVDAVLSRVDQIKQQISKLKSMEEVAKGFGSVPKHILKEHFDLDVEN